MLHLIANLGTQQQQNQENTQNSQIGILAINLEEDGSEEDEEIEDEDEEPGVSEAQEREILTGIFRTLSKYSEKPVLLPPTSINTHSRSQLD